MRYMWFMWLLLVSSCGSNEDVVAACEPDEKFASVRITEDPESPISVLLRINRTSASRKLLDAYAVFGSPEEGEIRLLLNTWDEKNEPCFVERILSLDKRAVDTFRVELLISGDDGKDGGYLYLPLDQLLVNSRGTFSSDDL